MAKICKTLVPEQGYAHRIHRTHRKKVKPKESFLPKVKEVKTKKDKIRLDIESLVKCKDLVDKANGILKRARKKRVIKVVKKVETFPCMRCANCDHKFKLTFNPLKDRGEQGLSSLVCPVCLKMAYYAHYYSLGFVSIWYSSIFAFCRDLIKSRKCQLTDFLGS